MRPRHWLSLIVALSLTGCGVSTAAWVDIGLTAAQTLANTNVATLTDAELIEYHDSVVRIKLRLAQVDAAFALHLATVEADLQTRGLQ